MLNNTNLIIQETKKLNLLYVEDDNLLREGNSRLFGSLFKSVYSCSNGLEGLEYFKINSDAVDVIITDLSMPEMNGFEMIDGINKIKEVPIFLLSAHNESEIVRRAEELTVKEILFKPTPLQGFLKSFEKGLLNE